MNTSLKIIVNCGLSLAKVVLVAGLAFAALATRETLLSAGIALLDWMTHGGRAFWPWVTVLWGSSLCALWAFCVSVKCDDQQARLGTVASRFAIVTLGFVACPASMAIGYAARPSLSAEPAAWAVFEFISCGLAHVVIGAASAMLIAVSIGALMSFFGTKGKDEGASA
ncbi:hypothetical protein WK76_24910 [Burkholderia ubonensis]|uniref:hypothetical protein n=1 Tax=Burkholderia ubonensis TaxID=101571 RepID=UPI00075BF464|nr:hypothetical protein [Burkholderia ubonensis]KVU84271.1 hypothetical protein WK76_24910 [Burkholderia ubonensis]